MKQTYAEIPGWTFDVDEISAGMYEVKATNAAGELIRGHGTDPYIVLEQCREIIQKKH